VSLDSRDLPADRAVPCAVLTVSDTRTMTTDSSGARIATALDAAGHLVVHRALVVDDPDLVARQIEQWVAARDLHVIITTGGTGIAKRDSTVDVVERLFDKTLPGFGELFRAISFREIGTAAMLSRATAGIIADTAVFVLPGSEHAVSLALEQLIIPELPHLLRELTKHAR
jgi:molybdopterin adenylyltransferase